MADERVLEGLALRRAVAEARGWRMVNVGNRCWRCEQVVITHDGNPGGTMYTTTYAETEDRAWMNLCNEGYFELYDTDLNTLKRYAAAMLPDTHKLEVRLYSTGRSLAIVDSISAIVWSVNTVIIVHTEPATAAWNAVLRWLAAREQEAGNE